MADNIQIPIDLNIANIKGLQKFQQDLNRVVSKVNGFKFDGGKASNSSDFFQNVAGSATGVKNYKLTVDQLVTSFTKLGRGNTVLENVFNSLDKKSQKAVTNLVALKRQFAEIFSQASSGKDVSKQLNSILEQADKLPKGLAGFKSLLDKEISDGISLLTRSVSKAEKDLESASRRQQSKEEAVTKAIEKKIAAHERYRKEVTTRAAANTKAQQEADGFNARQPNRAGDGDIVLAVKRRALAEEKLLANAAREKLVLEKATLGVYKDQQRALQYLRSLGVSSSKDARTQTQQKLLEFLKANAESEARKRINTGGSGPKGPSPSDIENLIRAEKALMKNARAAHNAGFSVERFGELAGLALKRYGAFLVGTSALTRILGGIAQASQVFLGFEKQFTTLEQVLDTTDSRFVKLRNTITSTAAATGVSATEITKGVSTFAQAGFTNVDELEKAISTISKIPLAPSFDDIGSTIEGNIAIFGQFGLGLKDFATILDQVNKLSVDYAIESRDFFEAVKRGGATFAAAGGSFQEFASLLTLLRSSTRETAATLGIFFKSGLTKFNRPASQALVESIIGKDPSGSLTILEQFTKLAPKFAELSGREQISLASRLVGVQQSARLIKLLQEINKENASGRTTQDSLDSSIGSIDESAAKRLDDVGTSLNRIREEFGKFFIELGKTEAIKRFFMNVADLTKGLLELTESIKGAVPVLLTLSAFFAVRKIGGFASGLVSELRGLRSAVNGASGIEPVVPATGGGAGRFRIAGLGVKSSRVLGFAGNAVPAAAASLAFGAGDLLTSNERTSRALQKGGVAATFGASAGAAVGSLAGPIGTAIGSIIGGTVGFAGGFQSSNKDFDAEIAASVRDAGIRERAQSFLKSSGKSFRTEQNNILSKGRVRSLLRSGLSPEAITARLNTEAEIAANRQAARGALSSGAAAAGGLFGNNRVTSVRSDNSRRGFNFAKGEDIVVNGRRFANRPFGLGPELDDLEKINNQGAKDLKATYDELRAALQPQTTTLSVVACEKNAMMLERLSQNFVSSLFVVDNATNRLTASLFEVTTKIRNIGQSYDNIQGTVDSLNNPSELRSSVRSGFTDKQLLESISADQFLREPLRNFSNKLAGSAQKLLSDSNFVTLLRETFADNASVTEEDAANIGNTLLEALTPVQEELVAVVTSAFPSKDVNDAFKALESLKPENLQSFFDELTGQTSIDEAFAPVFRKFFTSLDAVASAQVDYAKSIDDINSQIFDVGVQSQNISNQGAVRQSNILNGINRTRNNPLQDLANQVFNRAPNTLATGQSAVNASRSLNSVANRFNAEQVNSGFVFPDLRQELTDAQILANSTRTSFNSSVKEVENALNAVAQATDASVEAFNTFRSSLQDVGKDTLSATGEDITKQISILKSFDKAGGIADINRGSKLLENAAPAVREELIKALRATPDAFVGGQRLGDLADILEQRLGARRTDAVQRQLNPQDRSFVGPPVPNAQDRLEQLQNQITQNLEKEQSLRDKLIKAQEDSVTLLTLQKDAILANTLVLNALKPTVDQLIQELVRLNTSLDSRSDSVPTKGGGLNMPSISVKDFNININLTGDDIAMAITPAVRKQVGQALGEIAVAFQNNDPEVASRIKAIANRG